MDSRETKGVRGKLGGGLVDAPGWILSAVLLLVQPLAANASVELLSNGSFEPPTTTLNSSNSQGTVTGVMPFTWSDNSRNPSTHTHVTWSLDATGSVQGNSLKAVVDLEPGFLSGANVDLEQAFTFIAGRPVEAAIWMRASTACSVRLGLGINQSPYTVLNTQLVGVTTAWQRFTIAATPSSSGPARFFVKCNEQTLSLWFDEASITATGNSSTLYVSPNGSDTNAGSIEQPFRTLGYGTQQLYPGDTLSIRAGTYRETLTPANSGTSSAPITIAAYAGEQVIITGCDLISGWSAGNGQIWQAPVAWDLGEGNNQVFVDGVMMPEARTPNHTGIDWLHPTTATVTVSSTSNTISSPAFANVPDNYWAGAWFVGGVNQSWAWQSARIIASTGSTLTFDPATKTNPWFSGSGRGYVYGVSGALDAPQEWYWGSGSASTLFLRTPDDTDPSTHTVEAKRRVWCVDLGFNRDHVNIRGLQFRAGAVRMNGTYNLLDHCDGQYLSHFLRANGYSQDGGVEEGGGVSLRGSYNAVRNTTIANTAGSGVLVGYNTSGNEISRCAIHDIDYSGTYSCPIALHGDHHSVLFNTCYNAGRDVIQPNAPGSNVQYNDFSNPGLLCKDLGVIYTGYMAGGNVPATRIAHNWVHDNATGLPGPGIYLDNYVRNMIVDHNVIWNCSADAAIRVNAPADGIKVFHNTHFNCDNIGTHTYNAYPNNNPDAAFWTSGNMYDVDVRNNLELGLTATSQLVDPSNRNFRLKPNAAAIDAGVLLPGYNDDYLGAAPDLGAYEYGAFFWTVGLSGWSKPFVPLTANIASNGHLFLHGNGEANVTISILASETPTGVFSTIGKASADTVGAFQFEDVDTSFFRTRFYRAAFP